MKKSKKQNSTKVALFAGAAALMALAPQTHAQSSGDALINKLEQKGILSADEAKELRAEDAQDFNNSFTNGFDNAFSKMIGMPSWVTGYKLNGDFRGRYDELTGENAGFTDRIRLRYRVRLGLTVDMNDNLEVGFRVGSGDPSSGFATQTGNPLSNNSTFQDDGSKKFLYVDAAYGRWTPIRNDNWTVAATFGKMDNPFRISNMLFDYDLTPEGGALQTTYKINDHQSLSFNSAAFMLDEESTSSHDPLLYGGQIIWDAKWSPKIESSLGFSAFDLVNRDMLTTANVPFINQGNTRTALGSLWYNYNPFVISGSATYTLDSFPLYKGKFPIKVGAEYMDNPGAATGNIGYWGGITFGKSGKKGTWDISYRYEYLEADAWFDQMVDDDNGAYYAAAPNAGWHGVTATSFNWYGGTNIKGHLVKFNYSITDALTFSLTCYINGLINPNIINTPGLAGSPTTSEAQNEAIHAMADLMWKF